ncbi:MAG: A/G-specific adenine glycosylase [Alphaproteobacteria bacterium]|nr:A/G-specific adenine glycosylase [Alphaproteobacteria bacterium]
MAKQSRSKQNKAARADGRGGEVALPEHLLAWYDRHRRRLPWRATPGQTVDPYRVWLSEIMLQQTTVPTVIGHFDRFLARFPRVERLAEAPLDDVLHAWQGLGYYARARNLHRAARAIVERHGGVLPEDAEVLRALPGVGEYTVAAIRAIAFGRPANVVDGNVERVMARLFAVETPLPKAKTELKRLAAALVPEARPGDYAQALMDLGALICTPRSPGCLGCPLAEICAARKAGLAEELPRRALAKEKPRCYGTVFWLERGDGAVLLRRRPEDGLLGGMIDVPSTPWGSDPPDALAALCHAPVKAGWRPLPGTIAHGFTHFDLELTVMTARLAAGGAPAGLWSRPAEFHRHAFPTLTRKVIRHVLGAAPRRRRAQATARAHSG